MASTSFFSNFLFGKTKRDPYGTLSPEAKGVYQALGPKLQEMASQGPEFFRYQGPLSAPVSQEELDSIQNFNRLNAVRGQGLGTLLNPDINAYNERFENQIATPIRQRFTRDYLPAIQEEYRSFGTPIADVTNQALTRVNEDINQLQFQGYENQLNRIVDASGALNTAALTDMAIQAIPREITQAGYDREYANFIQANEKYTSGIQTMMNYLNLDTVTEKQGLGALPFIMAAIRLYTGLAGMGAGGAAGGTGVPGPVGGG